MPPMNGKQGNAPQSSRSTGPAWFQLCVATCVGAVAAYVGCCGPAGAPLQRGRVEEGWKWKDVPFTFGTVVCSFRAQGPLVRCVPCFDMSAARLRKLLNPRLLSRLRPGDLRWAPCCRPRLCGGSGRWGRALRWYSYRGVFSQQRDKVGPQVLGS